MGRNCMPSKMEFNSLGDNSFQFSETFMSESNDLSSLIFQPGLCCIQQKNLKTGFLTPWLIKINFLIM